MKTITPQLPTILGSCAAMLIAFLGLMNGTSPGTCIMKALAAFLVFSGFGLLLRFALSESQTDFTEKSDMTSHSLPANQNNQGRFEIISPGTSVADLLGSHSDLPMSLQEAEEEAA